MMQRVMKPPYIRIVIVALGLCVSTVSNADQVIADDLIVQGIVNGTGSMCVGMDCVNNEAFGNDTLRLKENNLRIRFHDTAAAAGLGQSWNISANSTTNGSRSYLNIELKSLEKDTVLISDGSYLLYDCNQANPYNPPPTATIPAGEPVTQPVYNSTTGTYDCVEVMDYTIKPIVQLAPTNTNAVALGYDSELVTDAVSIGKAGLVRQLKHVAEGLADTDLLISKTLNNYSAYATQREQIAAITQQLDNIDTQLDDIETTVATAEDLPPSIPKLISPADGATGLDPNSVTLTWERATDPDGDSLSYHVSYCEQADFSSCSPISVAANDTSVMIAVLGGGTSIALVGIIVPNMRRQRIMRDTLALVIALLVLAACNGGSSGGGRNMTTTVSGLNAATQYYWKVEVSDGLKTSASVVRSFTTG